MADGSSGFHMDWAGGWWVMMFWGPVVLIGLVALVAWLARSGGPGAGPGSAGGPQQDPRHEARRILAERYARGELDTEEYEERLTRLG